MPRLARRLLPIGAIAIVLLGAAFLRTEISHYVSMRVIAAAGGIGFCAAAVWMFRFPSTAARAVRGLALAALPCLAITFLGTPYYLSRPSPLPADPPLAPTLAGRPPLRILWIVFDDWDQRLTFQNADHAIPATLLDLESRSFAASNALAAQTGVPVVDMATTMAIPSLLYGNNVTREEIESPSIQHLLLGNGPGQTVLGAGDSIFARFRNLGWNSAAAGWYLPYCRVFASQLTGCYWDVRYDQATSVGSEPIEAASFVLRLLFETEGYSPFGRSLVTECHLAEYRALLDAGKREAADASLGRAYVHFNVPHPPFFDGESGPGGTFKRE